MDKNSTFGTVVDALCLIGGLALLAIGLFTSSHNLRVEGMLLILLASD